MTLNSDEQGSDLDPIEQLDALIAAGGNSRLARSLRVRSQLRDDLGRWVEMGRDASISVRVGGKKRKIIGKHVGADPQAPGERGLFLVEEIPELNIKRGVYSFKGKAVRQVLASLDPEYLKRQGIKDPTRDVNGNLVGKTLDDDIDDIEDVYFEEVGELDEALSSGKLNSDEIAEAYRARSQAGDYESYNVVANLEDADTEVLTPDQLGQILEEAGVETEAPTAKKKAVDLEEGDEVKLPDGSTKKVKSKFLTDAGVRISFDDNTAAMYDDEDEVELAPSEPEPAVEAEPAPEPEPEPEPAPEPTPEPEPVAELEEEPSAPELGETLLSREYANDNLQKIKRTLDNASGDGLGYDNEAFLTGETEDADILETRDMAFYLSKLIEESDLTREEKMAAHNRTASVLFKNLTNKSNLRPEKIPSELTGGRADTIQKITARKEGATLDPLTMSQNRVGIAVAVENSNVEVPDTVFFDKVLGDLVLADYVEKNKSKFKDGFKLGTWHDKENNEVVLDVIEIFRNEETATQAGKDRNQQGIFNLGTKEYIDTGGTGDRGRARRQREQARLDSYGPDSGRGLGQPEPDREVGEGERPETPTSEGDGAGGERLKVKRELEALRKVAIKDKKDVDYPEFELDNASLSTKQRQLIRTLTNAREKVFSLLTKSAKERDLDGFEKNVVWAKAYTDTMKRVFGSVTNSPNFRFGSGEKERLKNMTFFSNTEVKDEDGVIKKLEGVYIAKTGEKYYLNYESNRVGIFSYDSRSGKPTTSPIAYVNISWNSENARGEENERTTSIGFLSSSDEGKGLGAVAVTFARYVVEGSGKKFAHSYNLTQQGANNSKGIEPNDPSRHHYSQSEKILQMMDAPTMDLMIKNGWFSGDYRVASGSPDYPVTLSNRFLRKLDATGRTNDAATMVGPMKRIDEAAFRILSSYRQAKAQLGESLPELYLDRAGITDERKELAERDYDNSNKKFARLQFLIEELNWKDGPSKEDAVKQIRDVANFFKTEVRDTLVGERAEQGNLGGWSARSIRANPETNIDLYVKNLTDLADMIEADSDFDSKRLDRPQPLDREAVNVVEIANVEKVDPSSRATKYEDISKAYRNFPWRYGLHSYQNFLAKSGIHGNLNSNMHETILGRKAPSSWTIEASRLARRFSADDLNDALKNGIQKVADKKLGLDGAEIDMADVVFGELDFRRDFASEPEIGFVPLVRIAEAMQIRTGGEYNGVSLQEHIGNLIDDANGDDQNRKIIKDSQESAKKIFEKIDTYLEAIGEKRVEEFEEQRVAGLPEKTGDSSAYKPSYYDKTANAVVFRPIERFDGLNSEQREDLRAMNNQGLLENDDFSEKLGPELAEALTEEVDYSELLSSNPKNPKKVAVLFDKEALLDGFASAIKRNSKTINLSYQYSTFNGPDGEEVTVPISVVRDALQYLDVDTNGFINSEVIPNLSDSPEFSKEVLAEMHAQGLMPPESISDAIRQMNEIINIDNFTYEAVFSEGFNGPELATDPDTGKQYVVKAYSSKDQLDTEIASLAFYRTAGIYAGTARRGIKTGDSQQHYLVADFVPGKTNSLGDEETYRDAMDIRVGLEAREKAVKAALNGLAVDLLIDNIDNGFNSGNIVYTEDGGFMRIDTAGAFLTDPLSAHGDKNESDRYRSMDTVEKPTTPEQVLALENAYRDGSFEGDGIEFGFDFFLNKGGHHWMVNGGQRKRILDSYDETSFRESVKEIVLEYTPDKIAQFVSGIPMSEERRDRIHTALLHRRSRILEKFNVPDTYAPQDSNPDNMPVTASDRERLNRHLAIAREAKSDGLISEIEFRELEITSVMASNKGQIENAIRKINALTSRKKEESDKDVDLADQAFETPEELVMRPGVDFDSVDTDLPLENEAVPESEDEPSHEVLMSTPLTDILEGDEIKSISDPSYNGTVISKIGLENGGISLLIRDENGNVSVKTWTPDSEGVLSLPYFEAKRYLSERPAETNFEANVGEARDRYLANLQRRSNAIIEDVKAKYPAHQRLANGDLAISSRVFVTARGDTYKYELIVHRKSNEEFVAYVRETPLGRDGAPIGPTRVNKMTAPTHSSRALLNRIRPLTQGNSAGKGIYGTNPRNWFNQGRSIELEVTDPRTGMPIPASLVEDPKAEYIPSTGIKKTGNPVKDALIAYTGQLVGRGISAFEIYRRLRDSEVFTNQQLLDIIDRVESNQAFPGVNQIPYLSRNKRDIVRTGDRVIHFAPNGTIKEGTVRLRRPLSVSRKPNGDYEYTDVVMVKFDGRDQWTPIVSKNLEIVARADGEPAELEKRDVIRAVNADNVPEVPEGWTVNYTEEKGYVRFDGPDNAPLVTISRTTNYLGQDRFILRKYASKEEGRGIDDSPRKTYRFAYLEPALETADLIIDQYEKEQSERNQPKPASTPEKMFDGDENGVTELSDIVDAVNKSIANSPCAITAAAYDVCDITNALESVEVARPADGDIPHVDMVHGEIPDVDKRAVPVYRIYRTKKGKGKKTSKVWFWSKSSDLGDESKAREFRITSGLTVEQAIEKIRLNAEQRIQFLRGVPEGKNTRTLSIKLADGSTFSEEIDFETWQALTLSPISKAHFSLGDNGEILISEERAKYYLTQVAAHVDGIKPPQGRKPIMYVLGGAPASGKGGFTKKLSDLAKAVKGETPEVRAFNPLTGLDVTQNPDEVSAVLVDPDVFKIRLPEVRLKHLKQLTDRVMTTLGFKSPVKTGRSDRSWANDSHEESSLMAKLVTHVAQERGLDIVLDAVNAEKRKIAKKAAVAKEKGYKVVGRYLEAPFSVSMPSAAARSLNVGREVPIEVQIQSLSHLTNALSDGEDDENRIWEIFDEFELFSRQNIPGTNKSRIVEIATWSPGDDGLNFLGSNRAEIENARNLHEEYVRLSTLTDEERKAEIKEIQKESEKAVSAVLERQKLLSNRQYDQLQKAEDEIATEVEKEISSLLMSLEARYPQYSTENLEAILRNLIHDLESGFISDAELGKLLSETGLAKSKEDRLKIEDLASRFVNETTFYKSDVE